MSALIKERPSADAVLAKAVLAAREQLGLTQLELAGIVGVDRSAISRWKTQGLRVDSKTGELALLLVRVYRALYALFGGQQEDMRHFLRTPQPSPGGRAAGTDGTGAGPGSCAGIPRCDPRQGLMPGAPVRGLRLSRKGWQPEATRLAEWRLRCRYAGIRHHRKRGAEGERDLATVQG